MLRSATRSALVVLTGALALAGCQILDRGDAPVGEGPAVTAPASPGAATEPSAPPARVAPSDAPTGPSEPAVDVGACATADDESIDAIIGEQLAAFAAGDFAAALELATPGFRGAFTPETFEAMITEGFPVPASATGHVVLGCRAQGSSATATVLVRGAAGEQTLEYLLVRTPDGWLIDGAVPATAGGEVV